MSSRGDLNLTPLTDPNHPTRIPVPVLTELKHCKILKRMWKYDTETDGQGTYKITQRLGGVTTVAG
jgi:hypothetical protein